MADVYAVVLEKHVREGDSLPEVMARLASLFQVDAARIETLFAAASPVVKTGLSRNDAVKYQRAIERTGACCRIVPATPPASSSMSDSRKAPQRKPRVLVRTRIIRYAAGPYTYLIVPFVRIRNAAEYVFDLLAGLIWQELMGNAPNYSQSAQFAAFALFSVIAYALWHIPDYSYELFLAVALLAWVGDYVCTRRHILQSSQETQVLLKYGPDGHLFWRRNNPQGDADTLQCAPHEVMNIALAQETVEGGVFDTVVGRIWRLYLTLQDGTALLLDEHPEFLVALKRGRRVAERLHTQIVCEQSEGDHPLAAASIHAGRRAERTGNVKVVRAAGTVTITSRWSGKNIGKLCEQIVKSVSFLVFLLIVEGFMVKYGQLLNWLINPYLGWKAPDFPIEISFGGVWSLFAPDNDWKEWLKIGLVLAVMVFQGWRMGRKKTVVIGQETTSVFVGKKLLATCYTAKLYPPMVLLAPSPSLLLFDERHAVQLRNFQTAEELRCFALSMQQEFSNARRA